MPIATEAMMLPAMPTGRQPNLLHRAEAMGAETNERSNGRRTAGERTAEHVEAIG